MALDDAAAAAEEAERCVFFSGDGLEEGFVESGREAGLAFGLSEGHAEGREVG